MFVYIITNRINGKQYVGQTHKSIEQRFKKHCEENTHKNMPIVKAIHKYGKENFDIHLLHRKKLQIKC